MVHRATAELVRYFEYSHLPPDLQRVSGLFCELARQLATADELQGPELTVCLRKLLEAKDCAVRAALPRR